MTGKDTGTEGGHAPNFLISWGASDQSQGVFGVSWAKFSLDDIVGGEGLWAGWPTLNPDI